MPQSGSWPSSGVLTAALAACRTPTSRPRWAQVGRRVDAGWAQGGHGHLCHHWSLLQALCEEIRGRLGELDGALESGQRVLEMVTGEWQWLGVVATGSGPWDLGWDEHRQRQPRPARGPLGTGGPWSIHWELWCGVKGQTASHGMQRGQGRACGSGLWWDRFQWWRGAAEEVDLAGSGMRDQSWAWEQQEAGQERGKIRTE